ncbi:hypothetical protein J6590_068029 [Homalodisca vitripennis]|nr:hypothetical protein J6590_068029 [Homalodisca vitripennis]
MRLVQINKARPDPLQVNVRLSGGARTLHAGLEEMLQQRNSACYLGSSSTRDLWRFMGNEKSDFPCWNGVLSRELFIPCGRRYLTSALNVQSPFNMCFEDVMNSKITSFSKIENEFTTSYMEESEQPHTNYKAAEAPTPRSSVKPVIVINHATGGLPLYYAARQPVPQ